VDKKKNVSASVLTEKRVYKLDKKEFGRMNSLAGAMANYSLLSKSVDIYVS